MSISVHVSVMLEPCERTKCGQKGSDKQRSKAGAWTHMGESQEEVIPTSK